MHISSLLTEREAAEYLNISISTLQQRRFRRRNPAYVKLGKSIRYRLADLEDFVNEGRIQPEVDNETD